MWYDWFWYAFILLWAVLVCLKLYQICKRRNMAAQQRRAVTTRVATDQAVVDSYRYRNTIGTAYHGL